MNDNEIILANLRSLKSNWLKKSLEEGDILDRSILIVKNKGEYWRDRVWDVYRYNYTSSPNPIGLSILYLEWGFIYDIFLNKPIKEYSIHVYFNGEKVFRYTTETGRQNESFIIYHGEWLDKLNSLYDKVESELIFRSNTKINKEIDELCSLLKINRKGEPI